VCWGPPDVPGRAVLEFSLPLLLHMMLLLLGAGFLSCAVSRIAWATVGWLVVADGLRGMSVLAWLLRGGEGEQLDFEARALGSCRPGIVTAAFEVDILVAVATPFCAHARLHPADRA
jgi:hypothetical protein